MRRTSIDVVSLAAASCAVGCGGDFQPAQPWILPAADGDGDTASVASEGTAAGPPAGDTSEHDDGAPPADDGGADPGAETMADGDLDSGEVGDAPPQSPYQGGWDIGDCQDDIAAVTNEPGGAIADLSFTDQFGEQVRLYDFCHRAVLIVEGAFW